MTTGYSVKLPLTYDEEDGPYRLTKTLPETVKQNFRNLVFTIPGERVMDPEFGVGIHKLLFENEGSDAIELFKERLYDQVSRYLSFIKIITVDTSMINNTLQVSIEYYISSLGVSDALSLNVDKE